MCGEEKKNGMGGGEGIRAAEFERADTDRGFWNDTYSYGGRDWGRPVLWIVFCARVDTCVHTDTHTHTSAMASHHGKSQ